MEVKMGSKELKTRDQIDSKYKWDIEALISDESTIDEDLEALKERAFAYTEKYAGHLTDSAEVLLNAFRDQDEIERKAEKIVVYAHLKLSENNAESKYQGMLSKCIAVITAMNTSLSFCTPELTAADESVIRGFMEECPELGTYRFLIDNIFRLKTHVLTEKEEAIMAQMGEITGATNDIFSMLNDADISFGTIKDADGDEVELTHGNYIKFMQSQDRSVRKAAYDAMYDAFKKLINTISTTYNYNTKTDVVSSRIRKFGSSREAALSGDNVPAEVYDNLISTVHDNLPQMHRYSELRKKILGVDKMYMYDIYVPLIKLPDVEIEYEDGLEIIRQALKPLGDEYIDIMNRGISQRWIDVYENKGKTSGAFSSGCYESFPYILLNYTDTLNDVFTIIHEMGHSMHSYFSNKSQPYVYSDYSIFAAETASTVNENLLMHYLLNTEEDPQMRKYLLNMHLEAFRTTLFRQTMFAEFEDITHKAVESGQTLTYEWLCDVYEKLNAEYYGPAFEKDDTIKYEWARIPHFYRAFYVYQYATGYSAATAICNKILTEGKPAADAYIDFLKTGGSNYPIELLKIAGVDMGTKAPVEAAMETFNKLLDEFEGLVD